MTYAGIAAFSELSSPLQIASPELEEGGTTICENMTAL